MNNEEWVTGTMKMLVHGEPVEMQMTVPAKPVKPMRMLPIFQMMTNSFLNIGVDAIKQRGEKISCQAGCGACCRQPVPLAEIEAYQIAGLVENLPEPRRTEIKRRFAEGVKHFHEIEWFERMDNYADLSIEERQKLVLSYFYEGVPCPFLENESCSIHHDRPLSCREYMVTSPAENCAKPTGETIDMVKPLFKFSETLRQIGRSENLKYLNFVPMIRALEWAETYVEKTPEKPGTEWVKDFFEKLTNSEIPSEHAEAEAR